MRSLRRSLWVLLTSVLLTLTLVPAAQATDSRRFPEVIPFPGVGWQPEGIASGPGTTVFAGSRVSGAILEADVRTGKGEVLVPAQAGRVAIGLKYADGLLFVAGGGTGKAFVYDARTGESIEECPLPTATAPFVNDVVLTGRAAIFTNSREAELYRVPFDRDGLDCSRIREIPLGGEWEQITSTNPQQPATNANGIVAVYFGARLIVVNTAGQALYSVDPWSGDADRIDVGPEVTLPNGDGMLLLGRLLYVVQNRSNQIAVVKLSWDLSSGRVVRTVTDKHFDVPTTVAAVGRKLYAPNAKFGVPDPAAVSYEIVRVDGR